MLEADRRLTGLRDLALVSVLLDGGLRASEACALTVSDLRDGALTVGPSKSGRMRTVPLGQRATRNLLRYLAVGRPKLRPKSEHLFVGRDGLSVSRNTIRLTLNRLSERLGFPVSAHRFRHTATTMWLRRGADLETVRRLGGWADYSMLRTYAHLADADLRAAQQRFSPLDGL
jgi:site-specific recombinase XerD